MNWSTILQIVAIIVAGTMTGSELAIALFVHPNLSRLDDETHARSAQALAKTLGRYMPWWYVATLALNIAIVIWVPGGWSRAWWLACVSAALFAISIGYTIIALVPINNRIIEWDLDNLPSNWNEQRRRWDHLHEMRVTLLFIALCLLIVSTM